MNKNEPQNILTPTLQLLSQQYPALISQDDLATIFKRSLRRIRHFLQTRQLPLEPISAWGKPLYRLSDVANYIDGKVIPKEVLYSDADVTPSKRRGRPVGSKNKPKVFEEIPSMTMSM